MRMSAVGLSAAEAVNRADADTLADTLRRYGEEPSARRIARAIVERRQRGPITRTRELAELVASVVGRKSSRIDPATRTFQALRIHVNEELEELERGLMPPKSCWRPAGGWSWSRSTRSKIASSNAFLPSAAGPRPRPSRHLPLGTAPSQAPRWHLLARRHSGPARPRSRSTRGRVPRACVGRSGRHRRSRRHERKLALGGLVMALLAACGLYVMKDRVSRLEGRLRASRPWWRSSRASCIACARSGRCSIGRPASRASPPSTCTWPRRVPDRS